MWIGNVWILQICYYQRIEPRLYLTPIIIVKNEIENILGR